MHKFMYNPILLDKLLDDFWSQQKIFLTTVLVKQEVGQERIQKQNSMGRIHLNVAQMFQKNFQQLE